MSVTLSEVERAAKAHRAPLAGESAGYLVLAIADQVLCAPRMVQGNEVQLTADGGLRVLSGRASSAAEAELSLRRALDSLLLVASSGSAALTRASRRTSPVGLSGLVRELETALIPVNRAAARRALARIHRETARALTSGLLLEEDVAAALPMAAVAPVSAAVAAVEVAKAPVVAVAAVVITPPVPTAESMPLVRMSAELVASDESEALTVALEARSLDDADVALSFDVDVVFEELEPLAADSSAAPTVMHARVATIPDLIVAVPPPVREPLVDMPVGACTRPEPVVLRKSLCADLTEVLPRVESEPCPPVSECLSRTPTRGSLAVHLSVPVPEPIAVPAAPAEPVSACAAQPAPSVPERAVGSEQPQQSDLVICSVPVEDRTEQMPEVMPLMPGAAIIATRKSNVSELLSCFQVAADDSNRGLCRAIKELAGLDLTPAPFAALIR